MTRKEYIDRLSRGLEGLDEASKRDILLEIEDHIDELALKHPDLGDAEIVAGLEKPEILADSLRKEAGIPRSDGGTGAKAQPEGEKERGKGKTRITIDGEDLGDVIRRAFDVARLFKESKIFNDERGSEEPEEDEEDEEDEEREERGEGRKGRTVRLKDIPIGKVKDISCRTKSSDVKIFLSNSGFSLRADGAEIPSVSVRSRDGRNLDIVTNPGSREPAILEIGVPGTVDRLAVKTISGDVLVEDRVGDLSIETASGDVEVRQCSGNLSVTTASGDISLSGCSESLSAQTASGSVDVEADDQCNEVSVSSASGDIRFQYPDEFDAIVKYSTVSGDVEHDGASTQAGTIRIGAGLTPVRLSTVSGDIEIRRL